MEPKVPSHGGHVFPYFHVVGSQPATHSNRSDRDEISTVERPAHRGLTVGVILSRTLWRSETFKSKAQLVRENPGAQQREAWEQAASYAHGESPGRRIIGALLLAAATVPTDQIPTALDLIWMKPVDLSLLPKKNHYGVTQNTGAHAARGSELIARRGAGFCLVPGCEEDLATNSVVRGDQYYESRGPTYCRGHLEDWRRKADAKTIERAFRSVVEAWPTPQDRVVVRWLWSHRRLTGN